MSEVLSDPPNVIRGLLPNKAFWFSATDGWGSKNAFLVFYTLRGVLPFTRTLTPEGLKTAGEAGDGAP